MEELKETEEYGKHHSFIPELINYLGVKTVVEVGVFRGKLTMPILSNYPDIDYFAVDPWRVYENRPGQGPFLGMTQDEVLQILDTSGISKRDAWNIIQGRFQPYRPSTSFFTGAMEKGMSAETSEAARARMRRNYRDRAEQLERMYQELGDEVIDD